MEVVNSLGRRKTAVARVILTEGSGVITVNGREVVCVNPADPGGGRGTLDPIVPVPSKPGAVSGTPASAARSPRSSTAPP